MGYNDHYRRKLMIETNVLFIISIIGLTISTTVLITNFFTERLTKKLEARELEIENAYFDGFAAGWKAKTKNPTLNQK
jgi:hypothetical protein